jgi:hypothetical protein
LLLEMVFLKHKLLLVPLLVLALLDFAAGAAAERCCCTD